VTLVSNGKRLRFPRFPESDAKHPADSLYLMVSSAAAEAHCSYETGSLVYHQTNWLTERKTVVGILEPRPSEGTFTSPRANGQRRKALWWVDDRKKLPGRNRFYRAPFSDRRDSGREFGRCIVEYNLFDAVNLVIRPNNTLNPDAFHQLRDN
jgi:hypothetical protein